MNRLLKSAVLSLAIGATVLSSVVPASAGGWDRPRHHHNGGEAAALGIIGLAAGVIVGSAIADSNSRPSRVYEPYDADPYRRAPQPRYYDDEDEGYYPSAPRAYQPRAYQSRVVPVRQALEPWTPAWYDYCGNRYRTFDANSGTYVGYDGGRHFCTAG